MADIQIIMEVLGKNDVLKAAKATDKLERDVRALNKRFKEGSISQSDYMRGMNQLASKNKQVGGGYKNLQRAVFSYAKQIDRAQKENTQFAQSANQAANAQDRLASSAGRGSNQFASYNTATYKANQQTKRFASVGLQQAGYQVGDFAVQLQGGTNAAVAFGQQGSQLLGIFGAWGAVLGAGLAIGTALVAPMLDAADAGKGLNKVMEELNDISSDLHSTLNNLNDSDWASSFGDASGSIRAMTQNVADLQSQLELSKLESSLESLMDKADAGFFANLAQGFRFVGTLGLSNLSDAELDERKFRKMGLDMGRETFMGYVEEMQRLAQQGDRVGVAEAYEKFLEDAIGGGELTDEAKNTLIQIGESMQSLARSEALRNEGMEEGNRQLRQQVSHLTQIATIQEEVDAGVQSILSNRDAELQKQRDRIALARAAIQYGEDSAQYALKQQEIDERILRAKLEEENIRGNIADEIVRAWREANTLEDSADSINAKLARMEKLASSVTFHMMQGSEGAKMLEKYGGRGGRGSSDREPIFGNTGDSIYNDPAGGSGGSSGPTQADLFNKSRESLTNLIAKYDEGVAEAKKLRDAQVTVNDAVANGVITQQQGTQVMQDFIASLDQAEGPLQKIGNTMKDAFGNALMSIVDGTKSAKDAFKDMARAVLKQAYELLVIKPLMNSLFGESGGGGIVGSFLSGLTGQANGGAWNNGVQMYANGGVVGSPTAFQHKGGLGVMGEAGPEAIMPLKRGKNGKLGVQGEGGQGNVTVENHFHIAANGDESVKRIIQQEAPKIASYTQQQILDQRRRGGAMKSTFGG